jgi:hypothetical protein
VPEGLKLGESLFGRRDGFVAGRGEGHAPGRAVDQGKAEFALEFLDLARERGLCDVRVGGGAGE